MVATWLLCSINKYHFEIRYPRGNSDKAWQGLGDLKNNKGNAKRGVSPRLKI